MVYFSIVVFGKDLKRKVLFSLGDDLIPNSGYLKDCNLYTTKDIISNLEKIIRGELREYEWGGGQGRIYITSYQKMSNLEDMIYDENLGEIPTKKLLALMKKWRDFLYDWTEKDKLEEVIRRAFLEIKKNKESTLLVDGVPRYEVKASDGKTIINLVIEEEAFKLSPEKYIKELNFSSNFLLA